ncbi:PIN domain-containing protein, partial [Rhodococcus jostii]|uniref:PIN domain-containing protein n=1 Tax=Rhodococcus jostii TaxID=132919 RepID=UPI00365F830B
MTIVVVDTNIITADPHLHGKAWRSVIENTKRWGLSFIVPEVVAMETVTVVVRDLRKISQKFSALEWWKIGLREWHDDGAQHITSQIDAYEKKLHERFAEAGIEVVATPDISHMEIARRASEGKPPYGGSKDSYRDTLIWFTLLAIAESNPEERVWFVSNNHNDFGAKGVDQSQCPAPFHSDLAAELQAKDLAGRVFFATSLSTLDSHLAAAHAPLDQSALTAKTHDIDMDALAMSLQMSALSYRVDPEEAALPLTTSDAAIIGVSEQREGWAFDDAAGREGGAWTARFHVDTEVDISAIESVESADGSISNDHSAAREYTKVLRLSGAVAFDDDGTVQQISVTAAEALPDDPGKQRWQRKADRRWQRLLDGWVDVAPASSGIGRGALLQAAGFDGGAIGAAALAAGGPNLAAFGKAAQAASGFDGGAIGAAALAASGPNLAAFGKAAQAASGFDGGAIGAAALAASGF